MTDVALDLLNLAKALVVCAFRSVSLPPVLAAVLEEDNES